MNTAGVWQDVPTGLFVLAVVSTIFCLAVNAYTLRIAYPLWRTVPGEAFAELHREYLRLLGPVITFPHVVMFFATASLIRWHPPAVSTRSASLVCACAWIVVGVSAFAAGPIHTRFTRCGRVDERGLKLLLGISRLRTVLLLTATLLYCVPIFAAIQRLGPM